MTTLLRRPGHIIRLSRRSINLDLLPVQYSRPSSHVPRFPFACTRRYSQVGPPPPQNSSKGKNDPDNGLGGKEKDNRNVVRGPGDLHRKLSPSSPNPTKDVKSSKLENPQCSRLPEDEKKNSSNTVPAGRIKLSMDEEKSFNELINILHEVLPEAPAKDLKLAANIIKREGMTPEMKTILDVYRAKKSLDSATAAKALRLFKSMLPTLRQDVGSPPRDEEYKKKTARDDPKNETQSKKRNPENRDNLVNLLLFSALPLYLVYQVFGSTETTKEITWQEFRTTFLDKGLVEKIVVLNQSRAKVHLHRESVAQMYPDSPAARSDFFYYFSIGSVESFERHVDEAQNELEIPSADRIPIAYRDEISLLATLLSFGPTLLFIGAIVWISRRAASSSGGQSGIFGIGRSRAKRFNHETDIKVKFSDVAGMDEAKQEIMEFVSFLKSPGLYQKLGAKIPRGAILSGPPGTGKTLLAKATAGESQVPFFSVSGSEFMEMFVGVGPSRVRDLFATARKNTPCIVFIDEIDAIGKSRAKRNLGGGNDERESTLNQILTEMDGFNTSDQVVVLAGTNRPDVLDKALMRPGRFDRHIVIDCPTMDGRKQIFAVHLKKIVLTGDLNFIQGKLAALTPGFSGADIANCVNEAALIAARHRAQCVDMVHLELAIERVIGGLEKRSLVLSPDEKRTVAYHEAGHAICGWYLKHADPLLKVSIVPRGQAALGYAQYLPAGDVHLMNSNQLMDRLAMMLGGRVSEELHFDKVTSGASDDFNKATQIATTMVTQWGMSKKIGLVHFNVDNQQQLLKPFSEETAKCIDAEVRRIIDEAYTRCHEMLTQKNKEVGLVAEELLVKEMLGREDMVRIIGPRPFEDPPHFRNYFS